MRQRVANLLAWTSIAAGVVVFVAVEVSGHWKNGPAPLWWWILVGVVLVPGIAVHGFGRREGDHEGRWVGWWRGLHPVLRPVGIWATVGQVVFFGVVLPALGVVYLVHGNLAGKLVGGGMLGVSLLCLVLLFRRRK